MPAFENNFEVADHMKDCEGPGKSHAFRWSSYWHGQYCPKCGSVIPMKVKFPNDFRLPESID